MGKSSSGHTTVTQNNTPWNAPYLADLFNTAHTLYNNNSVNYYPGQTLAINPSLFTGYQNLYNTGAALDASIRPEGNSIFFNAANGGMSVNNSPAYAGLSDIAGGTTQPQQGLNWAAANEGNVGNVAMGTMPGYAGDIANTANYLPVATAPYARGLSANANAALYNPAEAPLLAEANGAFLGANPYLEGEYAAAAQPVINAYQTATAPQTDSAFESAGRYGGGGLANARSQNELNLGTTLGNMASTLYGQDYANERSLMQKAQSTLGSQYQTGLGLSNSALEAGGALNLNALEGAMSGLDSAANTENAGLNTAAGAYGTTGQLENMNLGGTLSGLSLLQSGFETGNSDALRALLMYPSVENANLAPAQAEVQGAQGLTGLEQAQTQDAMNRFYGNEMAPWQNASLYSSLLGNPIQGQTTTQQPYFTNPLASGLGAALGGYSLLNDMGAFGSGGWLSGLFGGGGAAAGGLGSFTDAGLALAGAPEAAGLGSFTDMALSMAAL